MRTEEVSINSTSWVRTVSIENKVRLFCNDVVYNPFMYQGSDPPVISHSPVMLAFIARTFHPVRIRRPIITAEPTKIVYELSFHQSLNSLGSLLGAMSPNLPLEASIITSTFSQKVMKSQENAPLKSFPARNSN